MLGTVESASRASSISLGEEDGMLFSDSPTEFRIASGVLVACDCFTPVFDIRAAPYTRSTISADFNLLGDI